MDNHGKGGSSFGEGFGSAFGAGLAIALLLLGGWLIVQMLLVAAGPTTQVVVQRVVETAPPDPTPTVQSAGYRRPPVPARIPTGPPGQVKERDVRINGHKVHEVWKRTPCDSSFDTLPNGNCTRTFHIEE